MLIGVQLIASGFQNWAGGSGPCASMPETGLFSMCPDITAPHPLPWGSAEFIGKLSKFCGATLRARGRQLTVPGLGFSVFITIILCERFGSM